MLKQLSVNLKDLVFQSLGTGQRRPKRGDELEAETQEPG